jgi:hypothetical protein
VATAVSSIQSNAFDLAGAAAAITNGLPSGTNLTLLFSLDAAIY